MEQEALPDQPPDDLLTGPDLAPNLTAALAATLGGVQVSRPVRRLRRW